MSQYILRRLLLYIPTLLGASILIFVIMRIVPGDVALMLMTRGGEGTVDPAQVARLRQELGLNDPLAVQYLKWLWGLVTLNPGQSIVQGRPVTEIIWQFFPATVQLATYTILISVIVAIPIGIASAIWQDTWVDYVVRIVTIGGLGVPTFWIAQLIILGLVGGFNWMPPVTYYHLWQNPFIHFQLIMWPVMVLSWHFSSYICRMTRSSMLEVIRQDYIRTAKAKGLPRRLEIFRHALRNALIPVVGWVGVQVAILLGGAVVMENIFTIPGIGYAIVQAIQQRDYPVVQTIIVSFVSIMLTVNLTVDLLYGVIDPRVKYS